MGGKESKTGVGEVYSRSRVVHYVMEGSGSDVCNFPSKLSCHEFMFGKIRLRSYDGALCSPVLLFFEFPSRGLW